MAPALKAIWSDEPTNVVCNMNGHTYVGLEHWSRLWRYYGQHKESGPSPGRAMTTPTGPPHPP